MRNSMSVRIAGMLAIAGALFGGAAAQAEPLGFVGGLVGLSVPDADDTSARLGFGITGGAKLGSEWAIAGYYLSSSKEEESNGIKGDFDYQFYGVEGSYHFEGEAKGVYLGVRAGMSKVKIGIPLSGNVKVEFETSPFHWGPVAGFNYFLAENFSLGGDVSYLLVSSDKDDGVKTDSFGVLNLMGSAKFWF